MKRALAIVDRAALPALVLVVALHMLFLLSFLVISLVAMGRAQAEDVPACTGTDMLAALEKRDPGLAARIGAEAAATLNGKGLLWRIDKPGHEPSFLFGTMHMTDPRVVSLTPAAEQAFDAAATVVIETTEILDPAKMMAGLMREPDLTMFTDGTTLMSRLSPQDAAIVADALQARGIPPESVSKMKPWMLAAMVTLPACELARKASGAPILDIKLAEDAQAAGKKLEGLETVADQLRAMASLPIDFHMKGLVQTLKLGDRIDDITETMIVLYKNGDTGMFWPLFRAVLPDDDDDEAGYAAFEEAMITARNKVMADRAEPILARGNAFIAVGAMHLPGPKGLIELLRRQGFTATSVD
ncbi:TraB/GumN family protein [Pseudaminobacter sp. NGMCC 1.201702]|uniref:TraB/GumN family protein n=1 Tax=Pseudaminobacter sp. NGMCC 1.201702 TaxID=3391825 RepID=UPI0039F0AA82